MGHEQDNLFYLGKIVLVTVLIALIACALLYIYASRQNPKVMEIVGSSILISLLLGSATTLYSKLLNKSKKLNYSVVVWFLITVATLMGLIVFLIYSSSKPNNIKHEIPVTYIFNCKAKEIAWNLDFVGDDSTQNYFLVVQLFRAFRDSNTSNSEMISSMTNPNDWVAIEPNEWNLIRNLKIFHELTEYMLAWNIGHVFTSGDMEIASVRGEGRRWLAFPNKKIEMRSVGKDTIEGDFKNNFYYDINDVDPISKSWDFRLPHDTRICMPKDDDLSSKIVLSNSYVDIEIAVHGLMSESGLPTLVHESAFGIYGDTIGPFKKYKCLLIFKATFDEWKYGFPKMRYYEQWVSDLLVRLQRRFAWGDPPVVSFSEAIKRQERQRLKAEQKQSTD